MNYEDIKSIIFVYTLFFIIIGIGMCLIMSALNIVSPTYISSDMMTENPLYIVLITAALLSVIFTIVSLSPVRGD